MLEINLEIPDQNIDTEGVIEFGVPQVCSFLWAIPNRCVCARSSPSGVRVPVPGRRPDQAQPGHQCSGRRLHATAGRFDPAVRRDHEGEHQRQDSVWILCQREYLRLGLGHEEVRIASLVVISTMQNLYFF